MLQKLLSPNSVTLSALIEREDFTTKTFVAKKHSLLIEI